METREFKKDVAGTSMVNGKNIAIAILSVLVLFVGYLAFQQNREKTDLISAYQTERNASEAYLNQTFKTIEDNLAEIRMREGIIQNNLDNPETNSLKSPEEKIQYEIGMIETIIEKNKALIAELNSKIDNQNTDLIKYKKTIAQTNKKLDSFKVEVANLISMNDSLQTDLNSSRQQYSGLESEYQTKLNEITSKEQIIDAQLTELQKTDSAMNTVFYTVGSYKELNEENLINKEGGILGLGAAKVLADNLDQSKFLKVDKRDLKEIPIRGKSAELVTNHDIRSYEILMKNDRAETLIIKDPKSFWRDSQYLVIMVKNQDEDIAQLKK